jgi:octaheme c-type cytochrome (tetrathionate reductase family)
MSKTILIVIFALLVCTNSAFAAPESEALNTSSSSNKTTTADHSQFEELNQEFDYAPDITEACLGCHNQASKQIHKTFHWTWGAMVDGKMVGKGQNGFNNYCVAAKGNPSCTQCHVGYGWRNADFDFEAEGNVDCLVCHDTTGTYKKAAATSGHPYYEDTKVGKTIQKAVDLTLVARNVGMPKRENCLACHANGGGGNGVKHGDTDMSLVDPSFELDVHMSSEKLNFTCQNCHSTSGHEIAGRYTDRKAFLDHEADMGRSDRAGKNVSCEACHGNVPHDESRLNHHVAKVSCPACHIPEMARGPYVTKLSWDWSTAGKLRDGKPYTVEEEFDGVEAHSYMSIKGSFTWGREVVPQYRWYKGELKQMTLDDVFDPDSAPIDINPPTGSYKDKDARIWPFKIHRGNQPYDTVNNRILPIKLYGRKGSGALWTEYDWGKALQAGADLNEKEYSGSYGFIRTNGYWPIKHMVAPKDKAVGCDECHSRNGRLSEVNDFYLVGRDSNKFIEAFGLVAVMGGLLGVAGHGSYRYIAVRRRFKLAKAQSESKPNNNKEA